MEEQADEPWRKPSFRQPDMLLTAENGWMGDMVHGEDKMAELREAVDKHREEDGLPPVRWKARAPSAATPAPSAAGSSAKRCVPAGWPTGREASLIDVTDLLRDGRNHFAGGGGLICDLSEKAASGDCTTVWKVTCHSASSHGWYLRISIAAN